MQGVGGWSTSPYINVLDLQMFPAMSKRHSELLQMYSNNEANAD
jgi:hypothetical protein